MRLIAMPKLAPPRLPKPRLPAFLRPAEAPVPGRAEPGERPLEGLEYTGITYRYDADVVFLGFLDHTRSVEGRAFSVWCATPHRFAVRLDDGRVVDLTVDRLDGEAIEYHLHPVRRVAE